MKRYMLLFLLLFLLLFASVAQAQTIADKLTTINSIKLDIKAALASKSQTVGDDFSVYDDAVASISGGDLPDVFPAGLEEDDADAATPSWGLVLDTGKPLAYGMEYLGNGISLVGTYDSGPTANKVFRSTNYGASWVEVASVTTAFKRDITYCGNGVVLTCGANSAGDAACVRSTNYGQTWVQIVIDTTEADVIDMEYLGSDTIIAGTEGGGKIFRSIDAGATWALASDTSGTGIYGMANIGNGRAITSIGAGIYSTDDYGATWILLSTSPASVISLEYCGNGIVLSGAWSGGKINRSADYGETWTEVADTDETAIYSIEYCENGLLYAGGSAQGYLYRSTDYGVTWTLFRDFTEAQIRRITYLGNSIALASVGGTNGRVYRIEGGYKDKEKWVW